MQGRELFFGPGEVRIGREPQENDLVSLNNLVSRRHARLYLRNGMWQLEDLGSRHGVFAHGTKVPSVRVDKTMTLWLGPPGQGQLL